jgi:selenocysteine lyase/cysteine desulfurase
VTDPDGVAAFAAGFDEEPGFLNFAAFGPTGRVVREEHAALESVLERARPGAGEHFQRQRARVADAVAAVTGFDAANIVFQPNTSQGLMHTTFGLTGGLLLSPDDFPSLPFAAERAKEALGALRPQWLEPERGRVTPGVVREQLRPETVAVGVSLVDYRTGHLVDLDGIRQVIGDRLLVVDAIQGFGVVDAPYELADVVASGGQKWVRAGWGTGFLALSERALEHLTPVWSGFSATDSPEQPMGSVPPPARRSARAFEITNPDPFAQARFAAALESLAGVGVAAVSEAVAARVSRLIDLADEFAIPVVSPRAEHERAGIVVLEPEPDRLTALAASLINHGVSATTRLGTVRLSAHASTTEETLGMLRSALVSYATS